MPLLRYFVFVGGALLALLFMSDAYFPKMPGEVRAASDLPVIRIHSDRKWPEPVVFDTSRPTIVPAVATIATAGVPAAAADVPAPAPARVRDSFAQLLPPDQKQARLADPKKPEKPLQRKRKLAKRHLAPPVMLVAQQPQFSLFGHSTW